MFSVELLPDVTVDRAVRDDWERLIAEGLPSSGRHPGSSNRPHLTLAVRSAVDPEVLGEVASGLPVPLELGGVLLFGHGRRFVLARQVVVSAALLEIHRAVASRVGPAEGRYANTSPDRWTPHLTLARGLTAEQVGTALARIEAARVVGEATGLRVWDATAKVVTTIA